MNKPVDFNDPKTQKPIKEDNSKKKKKEMTPGEKKERIKNIINKCVIAVLIIVILLLLLVRCDGTTGQPVIVTPFGNVQIGTQQTRPTQPVQKNEGTITFAGYGKFNVDKDYPYIELRNPEQNYVNMYFAVYDEASGELIAQTEMVAPGQFAYVNVLDYYKNPGVYNVNIKTSTYDATTNSPMNGMNQKMEVIIS